MPFTEADDECTAFRLYGTGYAFSVVNTQLYPVDRIESVQLSWTIYNIISIWSLISISVYWYCLPSSKMHLILLHLTNEMQIK